MSRSSDAASPLRAARRIGVKPPRRVVAWTFFVGAFVAGVGGVAYAFVAGKVEPLTGFLPGLKAFVAAVIGGIGSIPGAIIGGLVLGIGAREVEVPADRISFDQDTTVVTMTRAEIDALPDYKG